MNEIANQILQLITYPGKASLILVFSQIGSTVDMYS